MKSYFTPQSLHVQGKAWEVRILLSQWKKQSGPNVKVKDLIASRRSSRYEGDRS
nr:Z-ring formation inhibitor MciZ [Paenibacillus fonticola]